MPPLASDGKMGERPLPMGQMMQKPQEQWMDRPLAVQMVEKPYPQMPQKPLALEPQMPLPQKSLPSAPQMPLPQKPLLPQLPQKPLLPLPQMPRKYFKKPLLAPALPAPLPLRPILREVQPLVAAPHRVVSVSSYEHVNRLSAPVVSLVPRPLVARPLISRPLVHVVNSRSEIVEVPKVLATAAIVPERQVVLARRTYLAPVVSQPVVTVPLVQGSGVGPSSLISSSYSYAQAAPNPSHISSTYVGYNGPKSYAYSAYGPSSVAYAPVYYQ